MRGDGFVTRATRAQWHAQTGHLFPADPTPLPTPDEVAAMRERHRHMERTEHGLWCPQCLMPLPCDAARLLALVDLRDKVAAVNRTFTAGVERERDEARARLGAVLAECDLLDEQTSGYVSTDRIRRAATGEAT